MLPVSLSPDVCYQAVASRDRRFGGRFVVAVTTTGVYCRPGCPAPLPRRTNCTFFACAAAAERAGFRACRRCRPETAPGTPAWAGTSAPVARALRLIDAGVVDREGVEALAARVGMGERHLRRLFLEHVGAGPLAVARTRRVHFARRLLDETPLPVEEVALAAGFESPRTFRAAFRQAFGLAPSELRRKGPAAREPHGASTSRTAAGAPAFRLRIPVRPPYDWDALLRFLAARAIPGVERVERRTYARTFRMDGARGVMTLALEPGGEALALSVDALPAGSLLPLVERASALADAAADPLKVAEALGGDPLLAPLVARRPGLRVPGAFDRFETAVRTVLGQQVSVAAARTLAARLATRFGAATPDGLLFFPGPEALAEADVAAVGLTAARARTVRALAAAVAGSSLPLEVPGALGALPEAEERLRALPGIGRWTAQVIAMRALGEPDAFPAGDLALRKASAARGGPATEKELTDRAEAWRPWRAYAATYLLSEAAGKEGTAWT